MKPNKPALPASGLSSDIAAVPRLPGTLDFMKLLWAIHHALQSTSKRMEQQHGITGPQRLVVRILGQFPRSSAGEIARLLNIHPSTLTGILRRLEERGALVRSPDPGDARRALFHLTPEGERIDQLREGTPEEAVGFALEQLAREDKDSSRRVLEAIAAALQPESPRSSSSSSSLSAA